MEGGDGTALTQVWDFYKAVSKEWLEYETTSKENTSTLKIMENIEKALTGEDIANETIRSIELILKNDGILPIAMTLADVFGRSFSSGAELQNYISAGQYSTRKRELEKQIEDKKQAYHTALAEYQEAHQEAQKEADEKIKQTLKIFKNAGFDLWDIDYFLAQITWGLLIPDIGKPFDIGNIDPAKQNFGESRGVTNSLDRFVENVYRFVNKGITGDPEGRDENGKLVGFSIEQAILNPDTQQKTDAELKSFMQQFGVWHDTRGFDKIQAMENLRKPAISIEG